MAPRSRACRATLPRSVRFSPRSRPRDRRDITRAQFAAIGLSAQDFIGLSLDQSLEKIAKGYAENKDAAGAYAAVTDILGSKSSPHLNAVLGQLATEGFAGLTAAAKAAGQVMEADGIARMDEFGDRAEALKGQLQTFGAGIFNFFAKGAEAVGGLVAVAVNGIQGIDNDFSGLEKSAAKAEAAIRVVGPSLAQITRELAEQKKMIEERDAAELKGLSNLEKIKLLTTDIAFGERLITLQRQGGFDVTALEVQQADRQRLLVKAQADSQAELLDLKRKAALSTADELRLLQLQAIPLASRSDAQRQELADLAKKQVLLKNEQELQALLVRGQVEQLSPAEQQRILDLAAQDDNLRDQLAHVLDLADAAEARAKKESEVAAEIDRQTAALAAQRAAGSPIIGLNAPPDHAALAGMSDATLRALSAQKLKEADQYDPAKNPGLINIGSAAAGYYSEKLAAANLKMYAAAVQAELDQRAGLRNGSITQANFTGNLTQFDRLLSDARNTAAPNPQLTDANNTLATIQRTLAALTGGRAP